MNDARIASWIVALGLLPCAESALPVDLPPFVVIGDYGSEGTSEAGSSTSELNVASLANELIRASDGSIIVTVGDNDYGDGDCQSMDEVVGGFFGDFLPKDIESTCESRIPDPYYSDPSSDCSEPSGGYNPTCDACTVDINDFQFFPVPGNHDTDGSIDQNGLTAYLSYFYWARQQCAHTPCDTEAIVNQVAPDLEGVFSCEDATTPAYYDVSKDDAHFFFLDSNCNGNNNQEPPAGSVVNKCKNTPLSCKDPGFYATATQCQKNYCIQQLWLEYAVANSTATYKIVAFHHPPYVTGSKYPSCQGMQADYAAMGLTTVLTGHTHYLERLNLETTDGEDFVYYSNGSGGAALDEACSATSPITAKAGTGTLKGAYDYDKLCGSNTAFGLMYGRKIGAPETAYLQIDSYSAQSDASFVLDTCAFYPAGSVNCTVSDGDVVPDYCDISTNAPPSRVTSGQCGYTAQ